MSVATRGLPHHHIYLVGGAVRDELLGVPFHEKDWVVVGSSPEQMIGAGFVPVGKDFPVFLHPHTKEEYALARTERKTGHGYAGFSFYCGAEVTLEDDLIRRDLTINAMAKDHQGSIIDPYNGRADLDARLLRHVSNAFAEDPVRILRIARFAARYHRLGFTVAPETNALMRSMVDAGEVDHLIAERIWKETERALREPHPDIFIQVLRDCGALTKIMPEVDALFGVPQRAEHHPEIDTGIHTLLVLQQAAKLSPTSEVRFAALCHDLGKGTTPKNEWPRHIAHEARSKPLVDTLCTRIAAPKEHKELAQLVAKFHTHCHRANELKPATVLELFKSLDVFRRPERLEQFLLCCEADARGRTGFENRDYPQAQRLRDYFSATKTVSNAEVQAEGFSGKQFGDEVDRRRKIAIALIKEQSHHDEQ